MTEALSGGGVQLGTCRSKKGPEASNWSTADRQARTQITDHRSQITGCRDPYEHFLRKHHGTRDRDLKEDPAVDDGPPDHIARVAVHAGRPGPPTVRKTALHDHIVHVVLHARNGQSSGGRGWGRRGCRRGIYFV